jgi:hypothetical protein
MKKRVGIECVGASPCFDFLTFFKVHSSTVFFHTMRFFDIASMCWQSVFYEGWYKAYADDLELSCLLYVAIPIFEESSG